jgi:hypothetical protein
MNISGTALSAEDCIECPIVALQIQKKKLLEESGRSKKC